MSSPSEILNAVAPELAGESNKAAHIELAEGQTGAVFGDQRNYAVALMAAHTMTVAKRGGNAGAVSDLKEGQLSVGFSVRADADAMESTSYGMELLRLRRQYIMTARTRKVANG